MSKGAIRRVILLGAIAIIGILGMQTYWLVNTWTLKEQEFHQTVQIALFRVAKSIAGLNESVLPPMDLIKRMSSNYYVVNFNNIIDGNDLEFYLQKNIEKHLHVANFEYGIFDCSSDEMVFGDVCILEDGGEKPTGVTLPKYDEFTYYFAIFILGKMYKLS